MSVAVELIDVVMLLFSVGGVELRWSSSANNSRASILETVFFTVAGLLLPTLLPTLLP